MYRLWAATRAGCGSLRDVATAAERSEPLTDPVHRVAAGAVELLLAARSGEVEPAFLERLRSDLGDAHGLLHGSGDPVVVVAHRAALSDDELLVFAIAVGVERSEPLQQLLVGLTGDRARHRLEVSMVADLLGAGGAAAAGPRSGLQRAALVVPSRLDAAFGRTELAVHPRVMWALAGDTAPDRDLPPDAEVIRDVGAGDDTARTAALLVHGGGRRRRLDAVRRRLDAHRLLALRAPTTDAGWAAVVREATISGLGVAVEHDGRIDADGRRRVEAAGHLPWAFTSRSAPAFDDLPRLDWREVVADEQPPTASEWEAALGPGIPHRHRVSADQLATLSMALRANDGDADAAFRRLTSPELDALATHVRPRATWEDLILSPDRTARLRDLIDRYRHGSTVYDEWGFRPSPSRGLVALFSGPSGTGKTLSAEVVAGELGLDLYRMDLSSVVSKYIGETEKNLDRLFEAAGTGNFVLFFDEADALFAKRGDVGDAHDRYANIETSYLLQRLERYDGVVVLATNYEKNIDQAFMRRIHVRVDFVDPDATERLAIWRRNLRTAAPVADDVDLEWLATTFALSGAAIRNAVVDAAFLAAAEGTAITMSAMVRGVAREFRKLGRLVTSASWGPWAAVAAGATGG